MAPFRSFTLSLSLSLLAAASALQDGIPVEGPGGTLEARTLFDTPAALEERGDSQSGWGSREKRSIEKRALGAAWTGKTSIAAAGFSGVGAMQISVVDNDHVLIFDKSELNSLQINGHSAWGSLYSISSRTAKAIDLLTNSFCAGGGWLSNGTMVSVGGNPREGSRQPMAAGNGLQAVRLYNPATQTVYENVERIHLTSSRWYPSTTRLTDGSLLILGGMLAGGFNNVASTDNPTFEFFPPKGTGLPIYSKFLHDVLNSNLFPVVFTLPSGFIFVGANKLAMLYDPVTNTERRLKSFPNGVTITYPSSTAAVLLPLTIANNWQPEVLFCGGTTANVEAQPWLLNSKVAASTQCSRMLLTTAGIKAGWKVEQMPTPRIMGDGILTPDGKVFIVNGAINGVAGYGNVLEEVGQSNAATPNYAPVLYDPVAVAGSRFSSNFPKSKIERLYHSSATLVPDGRIMITGSNPNAGVTTVTYATRYEVEMFKPPYIGLARPTYTGLPTNILYGKNFTLGITISATAKVVTAVIMDLGYSTHGVHMNSRHVELRATRKGRTVLTVTGPQTRGIYPPGYAWLYVLADGVPSTGLRVMIGDGSGPPIDAAAQANLLANTKPLYR